MLIMKSGLGLLRRICMIGLRVTFPPHRGGKQMVTKPTHIDGGVLELVLTEFPDVVRVRVDLPVGTSDHSAAFIDVGL